MVVVFVLFSWFALTLRLHLIALLSALIRRLYVCGYFMLLDHSLVGVTSKGLGIIYG